MTRAPRAPRPSSSATCPPCAEFSELSGICPLTGQAHADVCGEVAVCHPFEERMRRFQPVYDRLCTATGCESLSALAAFFGTGLSAVTDARRRGCLPPAWLTRLFLRHRISPHWVLCGEGPMVLPGEPLPDGAEPDPLLGTLLEQYEHMYLWMLQEQQVALL